MKCIYCGYEDSKVVDSRGNEELNSIRRRRECLGCGRRFTTYETIEMSPIFIIKKDGSRQPFDAEKIKRGIIRACEKRPVGIKQIELIVAEIEKKISNSMAQEIKSEQVGELVMNKLKELDDIAYIRFASVYRKFEDVSKFIDFANAITS